MHSDTLLYSTSTFSTPIFSMPSTDFPPIISDNNNIENSNGEFYSCEVTYSPDHRWYFVAVAGTLLSIVSFICNFLIAIILLQKRYSHFFFLGLLAASDTFLSLCYAPVIAMDVIKNRLQVCFY
uniref:G-protein coupled receptors family 1 profile domain-containing protein n=1 Tax=Panagrolaimus sp. PS1159 TaxID=55785 RepID=A0AC35GRI5_9BILA